MLKIKTDVVELEFDDKLNEVSGDIISNILDKIYSSCGVSEKLMPQEGGKVGNNIIPEEPEEIDVRKLSLPKCISDLTCIKCHQSFLMKSESSGDVYFKNYNNNKLYNLGKIQLPKLPTTETAKYKKLINIYKDCIKLCNQNNTIVLVSDSEDKLICPFCGETISIKDMEDYVLKENINEKCYICGSETEFVLKGDITTRKCINNNCL